MGKLEQILQKRGFRQNVKCSILKSLCKYSIRDTIYICIRLIINNIQQLFCFYCPRYKGRCKKNTVADMSANGEGRGVNPLSATKIDVFFRKGKKMQNVLKRKIFIWIDFVLFFIFSLEIVRFRPSWIYWYADNEIIR